MSVLKLFTFLRACFLLIALPVVTVFYSLVTLCFYVPFGTREQMDEVIRSWAGVLGDLSGVRVHVQGLENLKDLKSALFLSNHQSYFDIPILFLSLPFSIRMAAKSDLFKVPLFGLALSKAGFLPVDRRNIETSQKTLDEMKSRFEHGESFWMSPEGTRFNGDGVGDFKSGPFHLAIKTGQPIVPVCMYGTYFVLSKKSLLINRSSLIQDVYVQILPPLETKDFSMSSRFELKNKVKTQIDAAYLELKKYPNASQSLPTQV